MGAVIAGTLVLYVTGLGRSPIYLNNDEVVFALQAHAIATTAHDESGRFLPLYFQIVENVWYHPAIVYLTALFLTVLPTDLWSVRLPTAVLGTLDALLIYAVVRRLNLSRASAIGAAVLLAVTPAHFIHARLTADYLYPLPLTLAWLILLLDYVRTRQTWRLTAAGAVLGLGVYTYIASLVMMPIWLGVTMLTMAAIGDRAPSRYLRVAGAFVVCVLPAVVSFATRPALYAGFAGRYSQFGVDPLGAPAAMLSPERIVERLRVYGSFFEPSYLFVVAPASVMSSTYTTGVFLTATAVLLLVGVVRMLRERPRTGAAIVAAGFVASPLAAPLVIEPYATDRALTLVLFAVLIAAYGLDTWLRPGPAIVLRRVGLAALALALAVQFSTFHADYFGAYRARSAFWFNGNHPGALEPLIAEHPVTDPRRIYLSDQLPWIRSYWKFYLVRHARLDLLDRTVYFDATSIDPTALPPGTMLLTGAGAPDEARLRQSANLRVLTQIHEPDGSVTFTRFVRASN